jgi:hypothetical protein
MTVKIDIGNASAVKGWLDAQIKAKQFRPCGHLLLKGVRHRLSGSALTSTRVMFIPECQRRSFVWKRHPVPDLEMEREYLALYGQLDEISCPRDCKFFRHRWVSRVQGFVPASLRWLWSCVKPVSEWYAKLHGATQVFIIVLLILVFAPRWLPLVIQLVKAVSGSK